MYEIWSFNFLFMSLSADIFLTLHLLWGYISLVVMWPSKLWRYILETRRCKLRILIYELMDNLWIKFSRNSIWQHFIQRTNYNECYCSKLNVLEGITIQKFELLELSKVILTTDSSIRWQWALKRKYKKNLTIFWVHLQTFFTASNKEDALFQWENSF